MNTGALGTRSAKGCWTCRLRHKKCDETHPSCRSCQSLGLICRGYGPRPHWMDRGPLEREEIERTKAAIAKSGSKRRRRRLESISTPLGPEKTQEPDTTKGDQSTNPEKSAPSREVDALITRGMSRAEELPNLGMPLDEGCMVDITNWQSEANTTPARDVAIPPLEIPFPGAISNLRHNTSNGGWTWDEYVFSDDSLANYNQCGENLAIGPINNGGNETDHIRDDQEQGNSLTRGVPETGNSLESNSNIPSNPASVMVADCQCIVFPGGLSMENAILLSYYMEIVVDSQFPFRGGTTGDRQWLKLLLLSSPPVIKISLALSKAHRALEKDLDLPRRLEHYEDARSQVLKMLSKTSFSTTATIPPLTSMERTRAQAIDACAIFIQAIYLEVLCGGSSQWKCCLTNAALHMPILIDLISTGCTPATNSPAESAIRPQNLFQNQLAAARALLSHLVWFDILATVSSGSGPFLGITHSCLLDSNIVTMQGVFGCQNWVVKSLCEILSLQQWRRQAEIDKTLSVLELAARGGAIHQSLNTHIAYLKDISTKCTPGPICDFQSIRNQWRHELEKDITLVFALATIIYLHVVVSGPNPQLPEIREAIAEMVEPFKNLARKKSMQHASWPLCVMACFADEPKWQTVSLLVLEDKGCQRKPFRTCKEALEIAEECRRLREEERRNCDWASSMKNIHGDIILN